MRTNTIAKLATMGLAAGLSITMGGCPTMDVVGDADGMNVNQNVSDSGDSGRDAGSDGNDSDNLGGGNTGGGSEAKSPANLKFVNTDIPVHVQGRIEVGDDVIAFTEDLGNGTQVNYIVPSAGDTAGRGLPNNGQWDPNSFLVTGKKLILLGGPTNDFVFTVSVYDTETDKVASIAKDDIRLETIPVSNYAPAFMVVDGPYVGTINEIGFDGVADDSRLKVIDVSGDTPDVIPFAVNPGGSDTTSIDMIMVDEESMRLVALVQQVFYVYDIAKPDAAPAMFDTSAHGGVEQFDAQHTFENGVILYYDNTAQGNFMYWDVMANDNAPKLISKDRLGGGRTTMIDDQYAILANGKALGDELGNNDPFEPDHQSQDGSGSTLALGFLGGTPYMIVASEGNGNTMRFGTSDGNWTDIADPRNADDDLEAGDVKTDRFGQYLGYKWEEGFDYSLGYAILDVQ